MIVRMWHGRVPTSKAEAYRAFTNERAIPDYQSVEGNISVHILERAPGGRYHPFHHPDLLGEPGGDQGLCGRRCGGRQVLPRGPGFPARIRASGRALRGCRAVSVT